MNITSTWLSWEMLSFIDCGLCAVTMVLGIAGGAYFSRYMFLSRRHNRRFTPGPTGYPFVGILMQIGDFSALHKKLTAYGRKYGRIFQFKLLGNRMVVLRSASTVETALTDINMNNRKEPFFQKYIFNGKSFAFANYSNHVPELRSVFFMALYSKWQSDEFIMTGVNKAIERFASKGDNCVNPDPWVKGLMADLYTYLLTGQTLPETDPDRDALWTLIDLLYAMLEPSVDAPLRMFPFLRFLPTRHGRLYRDTIKARDRVAKRYFEAQKATFEEGRTRGLIDVCLQMQADDIREKGTSWLSDDYIRGLMYDTTLAGMTEMMKSLRMLMLLMCHHQDVQSRVYAEIDDVIGSDKTPSSSDRERMPYTQAVVMEMLRYVSQTPLAIPHKCNKDVTLDGYLIKKDSGIVPNLWGIHHDEDVWGDPWQFRPDRFLDQTGSLIAHDSKLMKSFLPFSVGKRRCPGENFAMSRIFLIFTTLLQKLSFHPPEGQELPPVDPRQYNNKYPLSLPVYTCKVLPRHEDVIS